MAKIGLEQLINLVDEYQQRQDEVKEVEKKRKEDNILKLLVQQKTFRRIFLLVEKCLKAGINLDRFIGNKKNIKDKETFGFYKVGYMLCFEYNKIIDRLHRIHVDKDNINYCIGGEGQYNLLDYNCYIDKIDTEIFEMFDREVSLFNGELFDYIYYEITNKVRENDTIV